MLPFALVPRTSATWHIIDQGSRFVKHFFRFFSKKLSARQNGCFSLKSDVFQQLPQIVGGKGMDSIAELAGHIKILAVGRDLRKLLAAQGDQRSLHPLPGTVALVAHHVV